MNKLTIILLFLAFLGCKNSAKKAKQPKVEDTVALKKNVSNTIKGNGVKTQKPMQKDTIRDEEKTQMSEDFFQKAIVDLGDSSLIVYENIRADYRIFGYQKPDTNSRKMVFFSVFTTDVENNPYKCLYGSYYYSGAMRDVDIKYIKKVGDFVKANLIKNKDTVLTSVYFLKDWVKFETRN